jgi:hypothetical protein
MIPLLRAPLLMSCCDSCPGLLQDEDDGEVALQSQWLLYRLPSAA